MIVLSQAKRVVMKGIAAGTAAAQGLKASYFDEWLPQLDDALKCLPEDDLLPHELFRSLMQMADPEKRQIILVTERGEPVAVAGLRNRWGYWEPVSQWIVPGVLFPVKDGYLPRVLAVLGVEVRVAWWRWETRPPEAGWIKDMSSTPTHGVSFSADFERYWKESGHFKEVRKYRNRCKGFELRVNAPGSNEWTIKNWEAKWRPDGMEEMSDLSERLCVARYHEQREAYYTLSLFDKEEPAAAGSFVIHKNEAVAYCSYRNPRYDWNGAMSRLIDLAFSWGRDMGFAKMDFGGSFPYKERWAPEDGKKWQFTVCPGHVLIERRACELARSGRDKLYAGLKKIRSLSLIS